MALAVFMLGLILASIPVPIISAIGLAAVASVVVYAAVKQAE